MPDKEGSVLRVLCWRMVLTRKAFFSQLSKKKNPLDDVKKWSRRDIQILVEGFWNLMRGRVALYAKELGYLRKHRAAVSAIARCRSVEEARSQLALNGPKLIHILLPPLVAHFQ